MRSLVKPASVLALVLGVSPALAAEPPKEPVKELTKEAAKDKDPGFGDLVAAVKASPGCLGVETAKTDSGKSVIFAWFEDKKAALKWYNSETHQKLVKQFFPARAGNANPMAGVPDDSGPLMVIASVTPADKPAKDAPPFKQIAIEIYQPVTGGLSLGGKFAPKEMKVPPRKDKEKPEKE